MSATHVRAVRQVGTCRTDADFEHYGNGPLRFAWQGNMVRHLHVDGIEVLRGLSVVIRDANWGTHALTTRHCRTRVGDNSVNIDYRADVFDDGGREGDSRLDIRLQVNATAVSLDARLTVAAHADFETCRSGLSTLLPLRHVAGREMVVTHTDSGCETIVLPRRISPSQPLFNIRRLRYRPGTQQPVDLLFEGDIFEMEDQRNWSDASFKIYNRPLAQPTPYLIQAGEVVNQRVRFGLPGQEDRA